MKQEIELSIMGSSTDPLAEIQPVLDEFEAEQHVHVNVQVMSWDTAWLDLVKMAIYHDGPDVSEVGLTWSVNLTAMDALRRFTQAEVESFGGAAAFLASMWRSEVSDDPQQRWSIPWNAHTYVVCYRRDLLELAGVDATRAFDTLEHFADTLARLRNRGIEVPIVVPTTGEYLRDNLHLMASWVWGSGGHFINTDGTRTLFMAPSGLAGIKAYFDLYRGWPPAVHNLGTGDTYRWFMAGRAAITLISAPHLLRYFRFGEAPVAPEVRSNLATAMLQGVPYVGGSNLVIWRHVSPGKLPAALKLVRFLTSRRVQLLFGQRSGIPPARVEVLSDPLFVGEPFQAIAQTLQAGRSYTALGRWGVVEEKLAAALLNMRSAVLADPAADLDDIIAQHLAPVARKLDLILAG